MLYTLTSPEFDVDRVHFYPTLEAAVAIARNGRTVFEVAVSFDELSRRVAPTWVDAQVFDPTWTTAAELHADGSITARGPIPKALFAACLCSCQ